MFNSRIDFYVCLVSVAFVVLGSAEGYGYGSTGLVSFSGWCRYGSDEKIHQKGISRISRVSKCHEECQISPGCVAFSYGENMDCDLYQGGPYTHGSGQPKYTCYIMPIDDAYVIRSGACVPTASEKISTLSEAKKKCNEISSCTMINDFQGQGNHFRMCNEGARIVDLGGVVHLKRECFEKNYAYPGNDLEGSPRTAESPEQCQQLCQDTDGCVVFTFQSRKNECWLKHTRSVGTENYKGATSGNPSSTKHC